MLSVPVPNTRLRPDSRPPAVAAHEAEGALAVEGKLQPPKVAPLPHHLFLGSQPRLIATTMDTDTPQDL